jgi:hypothetical protein
MMRPMKLRGSIPGGNVWQNGPSTQSPIYSSTLYSGV